MSNWLDRLRAQAQQDRERRWREGTGGLDYSSIQPAVTVGGTDVVTDTRDVTPQTVIRDGQIVSFPREIETRVVPDAVTTNSLESILDAVAPGWRENREGAMQEFMDRTSSWTAPLEGPSRALGAGVLSAAAALGLQGGRFVNPFQQGSIEAPEISDALRELGAPEWAALTSELFVPDPIGAGRAADLVPLAGMALAGFRNIGGSKTAFGDISKLFRNFRASGYMDEAQADEMEYLFNEAVLSIAEGHMHITNPEVAGPILASGKARQNDTFAREEIMRYLEMINIPRDQAEDIVERFGAEVGDVLDTPIVVRSQDMFDEIRDAARQVYDQTGVKEVTAENLFQGYTGQWTKRVVNVVDSSTHSGPLDGALTTDFVKAAVTAYNPEKGADGSTAFNYVLNGFLRNPDSLTTQFPEESKVLQRYIQQMDSVFLNPRAVAPQETTLYRGMVLNKDWLPNGEIEQMIGESFKDRGFSSFSEKPEIAFSFLGGGTEGVKYDPNKVYAFVALDVPRNSPAISVAPISVYDTEQEVLFPRNTAFVVNSVTPRTTDWGVTYYIINASPDYSKAPGFSQAGK